MKTSFRVRLTLWNVGILAVALILFSALLLGMTRFWVAKSVDEELLTRAQRNLERQEFGPGGPGGPQFGPGQQRNRQRQNGRPNRGGGQETAQLNPAQQSPGQGPGIGPGPGQNPGDGQGPGAGSPPPRLPELDPDSFDPESLRLYELRRPRLIAEDGSILGPPGVTAAWDPEAARQALSGQNQFTTITVEGLPLRVLSFPHRDQLGNPVVFQFATDLTSLQRITQAQTALMVIVFPGALLLAGFAGLFLTSRALRPIEQVTAAAEQIDESNLSRRLPVTGNDELSRLATKFNEMVARLEQAFKRQKQFTADASHELRTPLTRIKLATGSGLDATADEEEQKHSLKVIDDAADSMSHLVEQLLVLARAENPNGSTPTEPTDTIPALEKAITLASLGADSRLQKELPPTLPARIKPEQLTQVVTNLLTNAARHTPETGTITLSANQEETKVIIQVRDTGEGIPPDQIPHVTERFFRVDTSRSRQDGGSGLGLAIVKSILDQAGASLLIESKVGEGTTVTVEIPL